MFYKFSILIPQNEKAKNLIKTDQKTWNSIQIIFEINDPLELKKLLNKKWLVVLSTTPFSENINSFGSILVKLSFEDFKNLTAYLPANSLKDAIQILEILNFQQNITYLNNVLKPLPEEKIKTLINQIKKQQIKIETTKSKQKEKTEKNELLKLREFIDETIKDWNKIIKQYKNFVSPKKIRELENLLWELLKLKKSTNIEKLTKLLETTLQLMENIELEGINRQKEIEKKKLLEDTLSDFDILVEIEKYEKAQKLKKIKNIKPSLHEQFYQIFWKVGLYIVLLLKEFNLKLKHLDNYTFWITEYIQLFYIFVNIWLIFYLFYIKFTNQLSLVNLENYNLIGWIFYYLIIFNIFWFIFWILKFFIRKKQFKILLAVFIGSIIIGYILKYIILSTFALPI